MAYYKNAISLVINENERYDYDGKSICSNPFIIVDKPHKQYKEGFPLDSLSVDYKTKQYFYDLGRNKYDGLELEQGYLDFFINALKIDNHLK